MAGRTDNDRLTGSLVLVGVLGLVLLAPPVIAAFDGGQVFGVPVVWAYLIGAWAGLIALIAVLVRRSG